jgi:hypothetical protein
MLNQTLFIMAIIIILAKNRKQRSIAHQLVRETYQQAFQVDINELHHLHPEKFKSDVLLAISTITRKVLGTMSVMYPNQKGVFPCESLFGFELSNYSLADNQYVEIGRFATTVEGKRNSSVVIALFLGAIKHLQNHQICGWTATVKDDVFQFLQKVNLPLHNINQSPKLQVNDPLWAYVGDITSLHLFDVSLNDTVQSFQRFDGYITRKMVELQFS